jgi:hypothetical protein
MVKGQWSRAEIEAHALEGLCNVEFGVCRTALPETTVRLLRIRHDPPGANVIASRVVRWHMEKEAEAKQAKHKDGKRTFNQVATRANYKVS